MPFPVRVTLVAVLTAATVGPSLAQPSAPPSEPAAPMPIAPPPPAPRGVETEFVSATEMPWEVMVDRQSICETPCTLQLDGLHWVTMRTREAAPLRLEVGNLGARPSRVTAEDIGTGKYATGITFATLGGMAVVTGIVFTAVGCSSDDREGMCTAGLITGGAGLAAVGLGVFLIRAGMPSVHVRALERRGMALYATGRTAGVAGAF